jgi:hypothetical protein
VREYARIQTFPDDWMFAGKMTSQYKQIGNAVPVNLGYYLGKCILHMLGVESNLCEVELAEPTAVAPESQLPLFAQYSD